MTDSPVVTLSCRHLQLTPMQRLSIKLRRKQGSFGLIRKLLFSDPKPRERSIADVHGQIDALILLSVVRVKYSIPEVNTSNLKSTIEPKSCVGIVWIEMNWFNWRFIYSWKQLNNRNNFEPEQIWISRTGGTTKSLGACKVKSSYKVHVYNLYAYKKNMKYYKGKKRFKNTRNKTIKIKNIIATQLT